MQYITGEFKNKTYALVIGRSNKKYYMMLKNKGYFMWPYKGVSMFNACDKIIHRCLSE